jgi:acyl carrier protein
VSDINETIRQIVETHGRIPIPVASLKDNDDLFEAGMTSHASVNVMLALEDQFDVEYPDALLRKSTFESVDAIRIALQSLGVTVAPS